MKKYLLPMSLGLLVAVVLAYLLREPIREAILIPLGVAAQRLRFYIDSLPQIVFWAPLTLGSAVAVVVSSLRLLRPRTSRRAVLVPKEGVVAGRVDMLKRVSRGRYYRMKLQRDLEEVRSLLRGDRYGARRASITVIPRGSDDVAELDESAFRVYLDAVLRELEEEIE